MAEPNPASPNPTPPVAAADSAGRQRVVPKTMGAWLKEGPGGILGVALVGLALAAMGGIVVFIIRGGNVPLEQSRTMLAVIFSLATITMAFCLMLGAFLSSETDSDSVKERFTLANQVLTPLIGIMGTILGFYFGTVDDKKSAEPLAIVDLIAAKDTVKPGESLPVTAIVSGGQGPWEFSLKFANDALPPVRRKVTSQNLRETIVIPAAQTGQLGVTVEVTDSLGANATLERKVGEWVTIEPTAPVSDVSPQLPRQQVETKPPQQTSQQSISTQIAPSDPPPISPSP